MAQIKVQNPDDPEAEDFDDLGDVERNSELWLAEQYITAHVGWLTVQGFRLYPPGVTPIPKSEEEALAMVQAAQRFLDSRKRKSGLVGMKKPKLIVPPGSMKQ